VRLAAALVVVILLLPLPLAAQAPGTPEEQGEAPTSERAAVLDGFRQLVDRGEARALFGLPLETFWRRQEAFAVALLADDHAALRPVLEGAAEPFAEVSERAIEVAEAGPVEIAGRSADDLAPEAELVIIIAPRPDLARFADGSDFNRGMLANFELGAWPFMFAFKEDDRRRGVVLLADDEPARAREAAFILATVWALGGVTLGPELEGLVSDSAAGPQLTPRGQAVFRLFFHPDLDVGMPIPEAVRRAETLLPR
jgi:hypothetical protein